MQFTVLNSSSLSCNRAITGHSLQDKNKRNNFTEIIESQKGQGWKGPLEATWANILVQVGTPKTSRPGPVSRQVLSISEDGYFTVFTDNLRQCLVILAVRIKWVLMFRGDLLCFSLRTLTLVLPLGTTEKRPAPASFHSPLRYL